MDRKDAPDSAAPETSQTDNLSTYRAKRSADTSPEPVGHVATDEGRLFVVHKHAATRAALRPAPRDGRRAALVGGAEGSIVRSRRTSGSRCGSKITRSSTATSRGSSPRGTTAPAGSSCGIAASGCRSRTVEGRAGEGKAPLRAEGLQAPRQVDAGEDQEEREGLAPHQGARRLGEVAGRCLSRGVGALRPDGGGSRGGHAASSASCVRRWRRPARRRSGSTSTRRD